MKYTCKNIGEAFFYLMDIFQGKFAFVELALKEYMIYYPVH